MALLKNFIILNIQRSRKRNKGNLAFTPARMTSNEFVVYFLQTNLVLNNKGFNVQWETKIEKT